MKIVIEKELESWWGEPEELAAMSDAEIIAMIREDMWSFIDGATWKVRRKNARPAA